MRPLSLRSQFFGLITFLSLAAPALAVVPDDSHSTYEVDRRGEAPAALLRRADRFDRTEAWSAFVGRNPGWSTRWDAVSGAPERLEGVPRAIDGYRWVTTANAEEAARSFLRTELAAWVPEAELELVRVIEDRVGFWVHFQQRHGGVAVEGSRVTARLSREGEVVRIQNRSHARIDLDVTPSIGAARAGAVATFELPATTRSTAAPTLAVLPIRRDGAYEYRLVWKSEHQSATGHFTSYVDARTGSLLWRRNDTHNATVSGQVSTDVEPVTANDPTFQARLPYLVVRVNENVGSVDGTTDLDGAYDVTTTTSAGRTFQAALLGLYGVVVDDPSGSTPELTGAVADGESTTLNIYFSPADADPSERDVYYHGMLAHDHIQTIEADFHFLDYPMPMTVNINNACNAFWDGTGINFFAAGGRCPATARVADVVYHEYGHGITDLMSRPFGPSGAMHEGFSDYYAATMTNQPLIGIGFFGPGTIIRRIDEDRKYPDDVVDEVHEDGLIIASALWDVRLELGKTLTDSLWHYARYGYSDNFDDYFADLLTVDDDNSTIYDGTPHHATLTRLFQKHGIGDYSIHVMHDRFKDTENAAQDFDLRASFLSIYGIQAGSPVVHIDTELEGQHSQSSIFLEPTGTLREWHAVLAAQPAGTTVRYYFEGADTTGTIVTYPEGGEGDPFTFRIGQDTEAPTIVHRALDDQPLDSPGLFLVAAAFDNLNQPLRGVEIEYRRNGGTTSTVAMSETESGRWHGSIPLAGAAVSDLIEYRIRATDGATTGNVGLHPSTDFHALHLVQGFARDFEASNGGLSGDGEWEWGAPGAPVTAYSGTNVWATDLDANYNDDTVSTLNLPPSDLSTFTKAALVFRHQFESEPDYDGGVVEVSTDAGASWSVVVPDGGYDTQSVVALGSAGFNGDHLRWRLAEFDLTRFAGQSDVRIRLRFASDVGLTYFGWYVDDLAVVERQILGRPLYLRTTSGDGEVTLHWEPPAGGDGFVGSKSAALTGYNVYRQDDKVSDPVLLTASPITERTYTDTNVTNGVNYDYYVTAVYPEGESPLGDAVIGFGARPVFSSALSTLTAEAHKPAVVDTTWAISNAGTGFLEANVHLATAAQGIDDVRIRYPVPESSDWQLLFTDPNETTTTPLDVATFSAKVEGGELNFRITGWEPFGDPSSGMNTAIGMDVDRNQESGFFGAEYLLVAGPIALFNFGAPAVLISSEFAFVGPLSRLDFEKGATTAEFAFPLSLINEPRLLGLGVQALTPNGQGFFDVVPDFFPEPWLSPGANHLSIEAGTPLQFGLRFESENVDPATYEAKVFFETNDADHPLVTVPVTFVVLPPTPIQLESWTALAQPEGVILDWTTGPLADIQGFHVYRRVLDDGVSAEVRITSEILPAREDRSYHAVDESAPPDQMLEYRLEVLETSGTVSTAGFIRVSSEGVGRPLALFLAPAQPNPVRDAARIRFGLPASGAVNLEAFSLDGRRVRGFLRGSNMVAGFHQVSWDGRDDNGHELPAGIYLVRLASGGRTETRKLTWMR